MHEQQQDNSFHPSSKASFALGCFGRIVTALREAIWISFECYKKPKPKLSLKPITKDGDNPVTQSKLQVIMCS